MNRTITQLRRRAGFTLIELMIAVAILGILVASAVRMTSLVAPGSAGHEAEATSAALAQARLVLAIACDGGGDAPHPPPGFEQATERIDYGGRELVQVTVSWQERAQPRSVVLYGVPREVAP